MHLEPCPTEPAKPIETVLADDGDGLVDSEVAAIRPPTTADLVLLAVEP